MAIGRKKGYAVREGTELFSPNLFLKSSPLPRMRTPLRKGKGKVIRGIRGIGEGQGHRGRAR
jgi:hypothetical protein